MNNKIYSWYLILVILLSISGVLYFSFLLLDHLHLVVGTVLEGLAFSLGIFFFLPYEFLQIPLLIFNISMFILIYYKKIERKILILPGTLIVNHLVVIISDPMRTEFSMPYGIFQALTAILLVISLITAIKFLNK